MKPLSYNQHKKIEQILSDGLNKLPTEVPIYTVNVESGFGLYGLEDEE